MIFALDPIKQFEIHKMGPTLKIGNFDLSQCIPDDAGHSWPCCIVASSVHE